MLEKDVKIEQLKGVGAKRAELLKKMGIDSVDALLEFYPRVYEDWSKCVSISGAPLGENCCIKAIAATEPKGVQIRKGLTLFKFKVTDGISDMSVTIFNNKYLAQKIKQGEEYLFFGKVSGSLLRKEMSSPSIEPAESEKIRPIYHQTQGINSKYIEKLVLQAINEYGNLICETLSDEIRNNYCLCTKEYAIKNIHFPTDNESEEIAKKRLVFEELLNLQLGMLLLKRRNREKTACVMSKDYSNSFIKSLRFELTNAQKSAIKVAIDDMQKPVPMNRLLQGDVGSGKTAVCAALMYHSAKNGFQSALMAPTEILAEQHYYSLSKMFKNSNINLVLLTGSTPANEKKKILSLIQDGTANVIIGTHALIQKAVNYNNLGLVVTDEQHRFGVEQRAILSKKGENPHIYVMSATPIPRTLGLVIYGDLDISILDEMPVGRKPVETYFISSKIRMRAYTYIKKHIDSGLQGYIVCPMVDEGEIQLASATEFYNKLKNGFFKNYSLGLLHGKMKADEKESVMRDFSLGKIQLLVATTVIEVGVDVPNANIMVIENAERFGLSQLHQLRGRVGRGNVKATCILISDAENDDAVKRLNIMKSTTDGFKIADEDMKLRGPGDFFGSRQHGLPTLKIASIFDDRTVLKSTSQLSREIIKKDPQLKSFENRILRRTVQRLFENSIN